MTETNEDEGPNAENTVEEVIVQQSPTINPDDSTTSKNPPDQN